MRQHFASPAFPRDRREIRVTRTGDPKFFYFQFSQDSLARTALQGP